MKGTTQTIQIITLRERNTRRRTGNHFFDVLRPSLAFFVGILFRCFEGVAHHRVVYRGDGRDCVYYKLQQQIHASIMIIFAASQHVQMNT